MFIVIIPLDADFEYIALTNKICFPQEIVPLHSPVKVLKEFLLMLSDFQSVIGPIW
jgi:hypothetical protein